MTDLEAENKRLRKALSAAVGYMRNAQIDLSTGAPKRTALRTIEGGIKMAEAALTDDLCRDGCQYAKDVGMYEHNCSGECQYRLAALTAATRVKREQTP